MAETKAGLTQAENDEKLIDVVAVIVNAANNSGDPRLLTLMEYGINQLTENDLIATLLVRYSYLLQSEQDHSRESFFPR